MTSWLLWRSIIPCCQQFQKTVTKGGKTVLRAAPRLQRQTRQRVEHRRKHIKYCHVPHLDSWVTTTIIFSSEVNIFLTIAPAFLGNFLILSLLPLTGKLRFIYRPNSCIVVWQRLILAYYSASCCYLLDDLVSWALKSLSIRQGWNLHIKKCIMWSFFDGMMTISVDRLLVSLLELKYKEIVTLKSTYIITAVFWILSFVAGSFSISHTRITRWFSDIVLKSCSVISMASYKEIFRALSHQ